MANPEHLKWLKEGIDAWNARMRKEWFRADLQGALLLGAVLQEADLREADLQGADLEGAVLQGADLRRAGLQGADLQGAVLQGADLQGADLGGAVLQEADLRRANLEGADLGGAVLQGAVLRGADLREANLREALLRWADLQGADLRRADLQGAVLQGADLREADLRRANLEGADLRTLVYSGPSTNEGGGPEYSDLSTARFLAQSQIDRARGDNGVLLPEGLTHPEHWDIIDLPPDHPNYQGPASVSPDLFLSYSHKDQLRAQLVHEHLTSHGFAVWWDQKIGAGDRWREAIADNLDESKVVLTLWSEASVASDAVREEAATAQAARKLVHARLDDAKLPYGFGETQYISLAGWDGDPGDSNFQKLIQNLHDKLNPPSEEELATRLLRASPVAFEIEKGRLAPRDTPLQTPPAIQNEPDKSARISGLLMTAQGLQAMLADRDAFQVPNELIHRVDRLTAALDREDVIWYALEDARDALLGCMERFDASNAWNDGIVGDLNRMMVRISELQPLLQPEQLPIDSENGKPPETEPTISAKELPELRDLAKEIVAAIRSEEGEASLDEAAEDLVDANADAVLEEDHLSPDPDIQAQQFSKLRRAAKGLVYTVGGVLAAIGGGVAVNLLTAPEAAATLALRLQPLMDRLLALFF